MSLDQISCSHERHVCKCRDLYQLLLQVQQLNNYLSESIIKELAAIEKLTPYMPEQFLIDLKKDLNNSLKLAISKESLSHMLLDKIKNTCDLFASQIEDSDKTVLPDSLNQGEVCDRQIEQVMKEKDEQVDGHEEDMEIGQSKKVKPKTFKRKYKRKPLISDTVNEQPDQVVDVPMDASKNQELPAPSKKFKRKYKLKRKPYFYEQKKTVEDHQLSMESIDQDQKKAESEHLLEDKVKIDLKKNPKIIIRKKKINRKYKEKDSPVSLRQLIAESTKSKNQNAYLEAPESDSTEKEAVNITINNPKPWVAPLFYEQE